MKCKKCEAEITEGAKFCPGCGTETDPRAAKREEMRKLIREGVAEELEARGIKKPKAKDEGENDEGENDNGDDWPF
jgi:hypothetical protein